MDPVFLLLLMVGLAASDYFAYVLSLNPKPKP